MLDKADARTRRAIGAIVGYLAWRPLAADSEQGIARWWLPRMGVDLPLPDVRRALDRLVENKLMGCRTLPDGSVIYRAVAGKHKTVNHGNARKATDY